MRRISVLIADDHARFREGIRALLAQAHDIQVVGEAADGPEALRMAEALQPDILLLDTQIPRLGGLGVLPQIHKTSPRTNVLILSECSEGEFASRALQQGAKGYLSKSRNHQDIVKAIRVTRAGEIWAERKVLAKTLEGLLQKTQGMNLSLSEMREALTDREQEIVKWVMQGMTNKEIAAQLGISDNTVKTHLGNIFGKLKVTRRLQLLLSRIVDHTA
ncbi:MAG: response regulator transcription factor [candidate division NC10 bacterium]|nr:response regulator transcription factor [candidate division NC10 bacterium]MDE2321625.1 response regulator transcription factor [candidate division NC10 bacterium]